MNFIENLNGFRAAIPWPDWCALAWFAVCWIGYTLYSGHEGWARRSLMRGTDRLRAAWMRRMLDREVVKMEGRLDAVEQRLVGLVEAEPDEDGWIRERRRDLVQGQGRDAHSLAIRGAVDDAPRNRWFVHLQSLRRTPKTAKRSGGSTL